MAGIEILISSDTKKKLLSKHNVTEEEVCECFYNREYGFADDNREKHQTNPKTQWFLSRTDKRRLLKVCIVVSEGKIDIKTAYPPNEDEIWLYQKLVGAKP
jgi:hypothetical protein